MDAKTMETVAEPKPDANRDLKKGYGRECPACYRPGKPIISHDNRRRYYCGFCNINWPE